MKEIEARLRDAFRADAETIKATPGLDVDEVRELGGRPTRGGGAGSGPTGQAARGKIALPLATAAAVAVIVAATAIVVPRVWPGHVGGHQSGGPARAFAGRPKFIVVSTTTPNAPGVLEVISSASGRVIGTLVPPKPRQYFTAVTALGNDRTFVVAVSAPNRCVTWLYQFSLGAAGRPTGLAPFEVPKLSGAELNQAGPVFMDLAASANGRLVAFTTVKCSGSQGHVGVIDVRTRSVKLWSFGGGYVAPLGVSLSANGGVLGLVSFSHPDNGHGGTEIDTAWTLRTNSPAGPLTRYYRRVYDSLTFTTTAVTVSSTGTVVFAATHRAVVTPGLVKIISVRTSSGAPFGRPYVFAGRDVYVVGLTLDTSGRYLLVYGWHRSGKTSEYPAAEIDLATGRLRLVHGAATGYVTSAAW